MNKNKGEKNAQIHKKFDFFFKYYKNVGKNSYMYRSTHY